MPEQTDLQLNAVLQGILGIMKLDIQLDGMTMSAEGSPEELGRFALFCRGSNQALAAPTAASAAALASKGAFSGPSESKGGLLLDNFGWRFKEFLRQVQSLKEPTPTARFLQQPLQSYELGNILNAGRVLADKLGINFDRILVMAGPRPTRYSPGPALKEALSHLEQLHPTK